MSEQFDFINAREARIPRQVSRQPKYDEVVSRAIGIPVTMNDPKLLKLVIAWKKKTDPTGDKLTNDNLMENVQFLTELKQAFNVK